MFASCSFSLFYLFKIFLVTGAAFADGVAGADGTAAVLRACAGIDDGFPAVAVLTLPPDSAATAWQNLVRCEVAVFGWVPFGCDLWIFCGEIVESRQDFDVLAIWATAVTSCAAGDDGLVFVAFVADPPDFFVAGGGDLLWGEAAVFGWVPFFGDGRILAGEVVDARNDLFAGADWAAAAVDTGGDGCAPFVAFVADPPDLAPSAGDDIGWGEVAVFGWVPLASELGIVGDEVVDAAQECAIAADWAAGAGDAAFDLSAPLVAMGTLPPN